MSVKKVLQELDFSPGAEELKVLKKETGALVEALRGAVKEKKIDADVFVGGSFGKGTVALGDKYDVDIYLRFAWEYEDLSKYLEKIIKGVRGFKVKQVHGSRDYFRLSRGGKVTFEVIPVTRIRHPREARNVTDLSYFHVNYIKKKLKENLKREVILAKTFFEAQGIYGAESYIRGFSGYGLECLIIYYKSFEKMLRELVKIKKRVIIDFENKYKRKNDVLFELNESKLQGPLVLVDPTWKERNTLAALSWETFKKFQEIAQAFLANPKAKYFEKVKFDFDNLKKINGEFLHIRLKTKRQEGDIAGTKLKKFSEFLEREIGGHFEVLRNEFVYDEKRGADLYLVIKSKHEVIRIGPPVKLKGASSAFKKVNKNVYEKNGVLHARIKVVDSGKKFVQNWVKNNKKRMKEMGIVSLKID